MENLSVFDFDKKSLKIDKPIRLIELFAGIGSQAKALQRIGANFEHYRICEFDKYAIKSYNAIHRTDFATSDITKITAEDLGIVDTDKYCYIMTYSFPCQDLSLAGNQKGMAKGSNTRSGLLWEVERLLNECKELPQILLMENVTQVHGKKNKEHFDEWIDFLESKGYSNFWQDLNAKNYGIPQNRNRTFMVSVLGGYKYEFPEEFPLELRLKDMLEDSVDEKFYLSDKMINFFKENTKRQQEKGNGFKFSPTNGDCIDKAVTTRAGGRMDDNFIEEQPTLIGGMQKNQAIKTEQRLEPNFSGCSNTLTTVQKDNYVCEPSMSGQGFMVEPKVYQAPHGYNKGNVQKVCPSITTSSWENNNFLIEPKVIGGIGEKKSNGGTQWYQQDRIYDNNVAMSVTTGFLPYYKTDEPYNRVIVGVANKKGYDEAIEGDSINLEYPNSTTRRGRVGHGVAQTLTTQPEQAVVEPNIIRETPLEKEGWHNYAKEVLSAQGVCRTLSTQSNNLATKIKEPCTFRIRKLTPKECWRLMGFDDADFEKAAEHNSNAQLYKQAGNSIVVDVLCYIFREML